MTRIISLLHVLHICRFMAGWTPLPPYEPLIIRYDCIPKGTALVGDVYALQRYVDDMVQPRFDRNAFIKITGI